MEWIAYTAYHYLGGPFLCIQSLVCPAEASLAQLTSQPVFLYEMGYLHSISLSGWNYCSAMPQDTSWSALGTQCPKPLPDSKQCHPAVRLLLLSELIWEIRCGFPLCLISFSLENSVCRIMMKIHNVTYKLGI